MTTYETGDIKVEPRKLRGRLLYYVAAFYNLPCYYNGTGHTPLDAIRDLLDAEESHAKFNKPA